MKISVLMTVYNREAFVGQAIESMVNQTLDNDEYEIIIINDGSTDGSQDIIDAYQAKHSNIRSFKQENKGFIATLNRGLKLAKADYIARMDDDDISHPTRLAKQYQHMLEHNLDLCGCFFEYIDERNKVTQQCGLPIGDAECKAMLRAGKMSMGGAMVIFNKDMVKKIGGFHTSFKHIEDYDLWLRIIEAGGKLGNIPQYFYQYRQHDMNVTRLRTQDIAMKYTIARYAHQLRMLGIKDGQDQGFNIDSLIKNLPDELKLPFELDYFNARHFHVSVGDMVTVDKAVKEFATVKSFVNRAYKASFYFRVAKGYFINKAYGRFIFYFMLGIGTDVKQLATLIKISLSNRIPYSWKKY